jgi:hypothetical protein
MGEGPQLASSCVPKVAGAIRRWLCEAESQLVALASSASLTAVEPSRLSRAGLSALLVLG